MLILSQKIDVTIFIMFSNCLYLFKELHKQALVVDGAKFKSHDSDSHFKKSDLINWPLKGKFKSL